MYLIINHTEMKVNSLFLHLNDKYKRSLSSNVLSVNSNKTDFNLFVLNIISKKNVTRRRVKVESPHPKIHVFHLPGSTYMGSPHKDQSIGN